MNQVLLATVALLGLVISSSIDAFPELTRHGYTQCTTCHISPNGGGVLTPYGRALSEEILSTWSREGEGKFLYGAVTSPEWLALGGDLRVLQLWQDSTRVQMARFILMQNDLEAAAKVGPVQVVAAGGLQDVPGGFVDKLFSRRHFVQVELTPEIRVRAGRFAKAFGINVPDHALLVRQRTAMDQGMETYNAEGSWIGEKTEAFVTAVLGRPDAPNLDRERGIAVRSALTLGENSKLGLSYLYGENNTVSRHLAGPYAIWGISPRAFVLAEIDFQALRQPLVNPADLGAFTYVRGDYEWVQGFHTYLTHEFGQTRFGSQLAVHNVGGGIQFFPRPHFEIHAVYRYTFVPGDSIHTAAFLFHFYE